MLRKEECRCDSDRDAEGENPSASCGNKVRAKRGAAGTTHFMMMVMNSTVLYIVLYIVSFFMPMNG
jgi:hypothetical protein